MASQRQKVLDAVIQKNVPIYPIGLLTGSDEAPAVASLMNSDTREYFDISAYQVTVPLINLNDPVERNRILSTEGLVLYDVILGQVKREEYYNTFASCYYDHCNSGPWFPMANSTYESSIKCCLNTFNNIIAVGELIDGIVKIRTSPCVFYTKTWCYTKSGHLYKINKMEDM